MNFSKSAVPCAKSAIWEFTISDGVRPEGIRACGSVIYVDSADQVHELANRSGLVAKEYKIDRGTVERDGVPPIETYLQVKQAEDSVPLREIVAALRDLLGIDLARDSLITNESRFFFKVLKRREFNDEQLNSASYLWLHAYQYQIGTQTEPTDEEFIRGELAVKNDSKQNSKVQLGFLSPFPPIGVDQRLKDELEARSLIGLKLNPIHVRRKSGPVKKPLWHLTSTVTLPRCLTKYINKHGFEKTPFDDWKDRWECAYFYDEGYELQVLSYSRKQVEALGEFDVGITAERTGNGPKIAFPSVIVSQRFRRVLDELKVPGLQYTPVVLAD
jgi:hypothetical protein